MNGRARMRALAGVAVAAALAFTAAPSAAAGPPISQTISSAVAAGAVNGADVRGVVDVGPGTPTRTWRHVIDGVVPGDHGTVTVDVRNVGPGPLALSTWLEVTLGENPLRSFYDDLAISWGSTAPISARRVAEGGSTEHEESVLAPGQVRPVSFAYDFPVEATGGNTAVEGPQQVVVIVKARIHEIPPVARRLPWTGAPGVAPLAVLAAVVLVVGLAAVVSTRGRQRAHRHREAR